VSDEKTRIIPRKQAAAATSEPRLVGDKIVFFCPNGDKIVVPAKLAGKRGLCTKCKVAVVIPVVGKQATAAPVFPGEVSEVEAAPAVEPEAGDAEEPVVAEPEAEVSEAPVAEPVVTDPEGAAAPPLPAPSAEWTFVAAAEASHVGLDFGPAGGAAGAWAVPAPPDAGGGAEHPAARLVARLWVERDHHGGIVELHLSGGSVILPEWYEPNWSRGTHGLFASQAVDGSVTLTAVAWDTIEKIVVRQVQGLPDGMFE
jgi:hypothetical protein